MSDKSIDTDAPAGAQNVDPDKPARQEDAANGGGCFKPFMVIMVIVIAALLIVIAAPLVFLAIGLSLAVLSVQ